MRLSPCRPDRKDDQRAFVIAGSRSRSIAFAFVAFSDGIPGSGSGDPRPRATGLERFPIDGDENRSSLFLSIAFSDGRYSCGIRLFAFDRNLRKPGKAESLSPRWRHIDNAPPHEGTAIIDRDHHGAPIATIGDSNPGSERE